jgi:hypothetical protein
MERTASEEDLLRYEQDQFLEGNAKSTGRPVKGSVEQISTSGTKFLRQFMRADSPLDYHSIPATTGKIEPKRGSVFRNIISPVHGRFQNATVDGTDFLSRSSFLAPDPGTTHSPAPERVGKMESVNEGISEGENDFIRRLRAVGDYIGETYPAKEDRREQGVSTQYFPGDFHYVSHPQNQGSSSVALERFRPGRESESVIQNITIRESKRSKARLSDVAYQRRSSMSPAIPRVEIGLLPPSYRTAMLEMGEPNSRAMTGGNARTPPRDPVNGVPFQNPPPSSRGGNGSNGNGSDNGIAGTEFTADVHDVFEINLIFEGQLVRHRVSLSLTVAQLGVEAASIFRLNARGLILMLLGLVPHTLQQPGTLFGPPPV